MRYVRLIILLLITLNAGLIAKTFGEEPTLAPLFLDDYEDSTSVEQRNWFVDLSAEAGWQDLGYVALSNKHHSAANYFFARSSDADFETEVPLSWLMKSFLSTKNVSTAKLLVLEKALNSRVLGIRSRADGLAMLKQFELQELSNSLVNHQADIKAHTERLDALSKQPIADEIDKVTTRIAQLEAQIAVLDVEKAISDQIGDINWPSPLSETKLIEAQIELSNLAKEDKALIGGRSEQDWAALAKGNLVAWEEQSNNPFGPSPLTKYKTSARLAGAAQNGALTFLTKNASDPNVAAHKKALDQFQQTKELFDASATAEAKQMLDEARAEFRRLEAALIDQEPIYKDLIGLRDENLYLTESQLQSLKDLMRQPELSALLAETASDTKTPAGIRDLVKPAALLSSSTIDTAACTAINFQCEQRCFGLYVVDCTIAESGAQSDCLAGNTPNLDFYNGGGSGGFIGRCDPLIGVAMPIKAVFAHEAVGNNWNSDSRGGKPTSSVNSSDEEDKQALQNVVSDTLSTLFDPDATCGISPSEDSSGLEAYLVDFQNNIEEEKRRTQSENDRLWRMAEAERRLALIRKNTRLMNDPIVKDLVEELATNPAALVDPEFGKNLAEKLIDRALNAAETNTSSSGNAKQAEWEKKAREINALAKNANEIADKFGVKSDALSKLTGYGDNAAGILDGAREGDGEKIRSGIQGLVSGVPGPAGSVLKTPFGRAAAASVTFASDITNDSADVLGQLNKSIGSDNPEDLEKLAAMSEAVQKKLTVKNYVDKVLVEPFKNFVKEDVPGGKVLMGVFDYFTGKSEPKASSSCAIPAPPLP